MNVRNQLQLQNDILVGTGAILFSLAMLLLVAVYVLQPLAGSGRGRDHDSSQELSALQAERDRVLDSIQEVDMDRSMGKVSEQDYQRQRKALAIEAAEILRSIDKLRQNGAPDELSMELEAAVAQLRGKRLVPSAQQNGDETDAAELACQTCGKSIFLGDRFCGNCGATLEEQVA